MGILKKIKTLLAGVFLVVTVLGLCQNVLASNGVTFGVSPMNQSVVLVPGNRYHGSFQVTNPNTSENDIEYEIEQRSFYVDEDYNTVYDEEDNMIVDWTTIESGASGVVEPNSHKDVMFAIDVPLDAPAGGYYEAFRVIAKNHMLEEKIENGAGIQEQIIITHLVFIEIAGNTIKQGEVQEASVSSFLLSGNITGKSAIKNTGNIHGTAKYTLQVFPLFSSEEVYTNEEDPDTKTILPDRTLYNETIWADTPTFGIFNVVYTVEFEGVTTQVSKMVIKCPVWLLFIILFAIIALVIWIFLKVNKRRGAKRER